LIHFYKRQKASQFQNAFIQHVVIQGNL